MNTKLLKISFINAFGVLIYVALVATFMFNANKFFGTGDSALSTVAFLLLFLISALVTGLLVLGKPISLYFNGLKADGVKLLIYTLGWLVVLVLVVFLVLLARGNEDNWICSNGQWVKHGQPSQPMPTTGCGQAMSNQTEINFEKTGNLFVTAENQSLTLYWSLLYEEPGKPALSAILDMNNIYNQYNQTFLDFKAGEQVQVKGFNDGTKVIVKELSVVK